ncbi:MAG: HAD family hydrolase, partial [Nevskiales bacterium]
GIGLLDGAEDFLKAQVAAGRRLWLVTNAHPKTLALKAERTGIDRYFERCVTSHELGHAKEDARFWANFDTHCPVPREGRVMVDDNTRVLRAARAHGADQCVQITQPDSSVAEPHKAAEGFVAVRGLFELMP